MESKVFNLEILTPNKKVFSGSVTSLVAPGEIGYLGVLANHAPLVTTLVPGNITTRDPAGSPRTLRSTGTGFLEVYRNTATVLVEGVSE